MRRERFDKMNVVPFIDIVLVLLVIILATATFQSIKVDIPSASSKVNEEKKSIYISVDKEGKYYYDKEELSLDLIKDKLMTLDPKKDIISLKMDQSSEFRYFVDIIDILKTKGFENISIITKK